MFNINFIDDWIRTADLCIGSDRSTNKPQALRSVILQNWAQSSCPLMT